MTSESKFLNLKDFEDLLRFFSAALKAGLMETNEVVQFADKVISEQSNSHPIWIELSTCVNMPSYDAVSIINNLVGQHTSQLTARALLGHLFEQFSNKQISLQKTIDVIKWLTWEDALHNEEISNLYSLHDGYRHASKGDYLTIEDVEKDSFDFLETYKEFKVDNFHEWKTINEKISTQIEANRLSYIAKESSSNSISLYSALNQMIYSKRVAILRFLAVLFVLIILSKLRNLK